jgi:hypothetical protein
MIVVPDGGEIGDNTPALMAAALVPGTSMAVP